VRANDSDPDSVAALVTAAIVAQPAHGTVVVEGSGYRYTPVAGYAGTDSFTYRLTDELDAQSAVATVAITVSAPPAPGGGKKKGGGALDLLALAGLLGLLLLKTGQVRSRTRASSAA
jgi:hypothetical protein